VETGRRLCVKAKDGSARRRVLDIVALFSKQYQIEPNVTIRVIRSIQEHKGFGSGTQLAVAIATALAHIFDIKTSAYDLSSVMGRGMRSSIGIWSFEHGGLIIDSGKRRLKNGATAAEPPKAILRYDFPNEWKFVIVVPQEKHGLSGEQEKKAIGFIHPSKKISEEICRLVMIRLLPSLIEKDIKGFGGALSQIDSKTGLFFKAIQGGIYSEKLSYKLIDRLLASGAYGAGQSSWGPAVYGLALKEETEHLADCMQDYLNRNHINGRVMIASGRNTGAEVEIVESERFCRINNVHIADIDSGLSCFARPVVSQGRHHAHLELNPNILGEKGNEKNINPTG
jgi:beta-ribofuranosylaminobenzene 5'-phosphate synthase